MVKVKSARNDRDHALRQQANIHTTALEEMIHQSIDMLKNCKTKGQIFAAS